MADGSRLRQWTGSDGPTWATKTDVAYWTLREQVLDGRLAPGTVIEQETLARQLGLSTTPLREALRRLEAEGLLHQIAHREMRVPELSRRELEELYTVRLQLDPYAIRLGAQKATEADRGAVTELRDIPVGLSSLEMLMHHRKLHRIMYAAAGNQVLTDVLDTLWDRSDRYRLLLMRDFSESGTRVETHWAAADAFVAGKGAEAAKLLRQSLMAVRGILVDRIEQVGDRVNGKPLLAPHDEAVGDAG